MSGEAIASSTECFIDVKDPATQRHVNKVPKITSSEFDRAVESCKMAGVDWRTTPLPQRQRVMHKFLHLINQYKRDIAACITREQGKTISDAHGDVFRGLEVCFTKFLKCMELQHVDSLTVAAKRNLGKRPQLALD